MCRHTPLHWALETAACQARSLCNMRCCQMFLPISEDTTLFRANSVQRASVDSRKDRKPVMVT